MRLLLSRKIFSISITLISILGYGFFVFAASGPFAPGEELNPSCAPGTLNCYVQQLFATTNSTYTWIGDGAGGGNASTDNTFFAGINAGYGALNADGSNFIGTYAGVGAEEAYSANFSGPYAGCYAINAHDTNAFGDHAACYAINADNANVFGNYAGYYATDAARAVLFGQRAGYYASGAHDAAFLGYRSGYYASGAGDSVFVGSDAGAYATNAERSNFFGRRAGMGATNANNSTFLGYEAGTGPAQGLVTDLEGQDTVGAVYGDNSLMIGYRAGYNNSSDPNFLSITVPYAATGLVNFIGYESGFDASGAIGSTFVGYRSGFEATHALTSTFVGNLSGYQATFAAGSNFFGISSGSGAINANNSVFLGTRSGYAAINAGGSTFLGNRSGYQADNAENSVFVGNSAGEEADNATRAIFFGPSAGYFAANAADSFFAGTDSGNGSTNAFQSIFIGNSAGRSASDAPFSVFIGFDSGNTSTNASNSVFVGHNAGWNAPDATNSIFIGSNAGITDSVVNSRATVTYSGLSGTFEIGELVTDINTTRAFYIFADSGSILSIDGPSDYNLNPGDTIVGSSSGATAQVVSVTQGTASILIGLHSQTQGYTNSIALGTEAKNTATNQFMVGSEDFPIDQFVMVGTGGTTCATDANGTACSSDERLKDNIHDLSVGVLDKLAQVRTVTYNWKEGTDQDEHIGFLAQDIKQYFPELVSIGTTGYYSVNYAGMAPVLTQAIRELNIKLENIELAASLENQTFLESIMTWLGDTANGLALVISDTIKARNELCIDDICMTKDQLRTIIQNNVSGGFGYGYGGND